MSLLVDIEKKLGSFTLRAHFEAESGATALLGASGSGKSVTLKCIAGILTPDAGRIVLDGETLFDSARGIDLPPQRRRVGYLFQQYALFPHMTVAQNILCGVRTGTRAERSARAAELLRRFRLEESAQKYPAQISGGQQQRTALARIFASEPRALLLDEPFSALDSFLRWKLELELSALLSGFTGSILWVSHDLGECRRNCPSVCIMENGASGAVLPMETLLRHPPTYGAALITGCKNFLRAAPCADGVHLPDWDVTLPLRRAPRAFTTLALPDDALALGGSLPLTVTRVLTELEREAVLLRPAASAPDAPSVHLLLPTGTHAAVGDVLLAALDEEKLLYY